MQLSDDDFTLLGLPPRQALAAERLDAARRALQAQVHPDRFAAQGAAAQRLATQWAVRVNQAYQRLKRPLSRAAYLCELRGVAIQAEQNTAMPPAFLVKQMQWREALEEARGPAELQNLVGDVQSAQRDGLAEVQRLLDGVDGADGLDAASAARRAAERVRELMFIERFADDLATRLDQFSAV